MRRFIALLMLGLFLSGCATVGHLKTPSGRPEVFIEGATLESATRSCANSLSSNGWEIEKVSDWTVQAITSTNSTMADFVFGTPGTNYKTWYRMVCRFSKESNGVRVYATQYLVSSRGTGFEQANELTSQKAYEGTQSWLESIQNSIQHRR